MAPSEFSNAQRTVYLVNRYIGGSIDFAELQELDAWRKQREANETLFQELIHPEMQEKAIHRMQSYDSKASLDRIKEKIDQDRGPKEVRPIHWQQVLIAASLLILFGTFIFKYVYQESDKAKTALNTPSNFIPAGSNKAILTLANGQKINLDDSKAGTIAKENGAAIQKQSGGLIAYVPYQKNDDTVTAYNQIETPRGGQYSVVLPDGTKVWLNAASSLRYPSSFKGNERMVNLTGEAYFEVVHNARQPFIVKTATQTIQDIGTSFNVNAYSDEPASTTTLVQGAVDITAKNKKLILKPGQQAVLSDNDVKVLNADIETATAWKNGQLAFRHSDIQNVLRQIARWYNIEIVYQGKAPNITITGGVSRSEDLSAILKMLQLSEVHFTQQGHTLLIRK